MCIGGRYMKSQVKQVLVKQVLREVYKRQGYIVIGQLPHHHPMRLGDEVTKIFQYDMGAPFLLSDLATQKDWDKQNDLVAELRPGWKRLASEKGARFFKIKATTDKGFKKFPSAERVPPAA
jgi:hypothetical protein